MVDEGLDRGLGDGLGINMGGASAKAPEGWCVPPAPTGVREAAVSYVVAR